MIWIAICDCAILDRFAKNKLNIQIKTSNNIYFVSDL